MACPRTHGLTFPSENLQNNVPNQFVELNETVVVSKGEGGGYHTWYDRYREEFRSAGKSWDWTLELRIAKLTLRELPRRPRPYLTMIIPKGSLQKQARSLDRPA